MDDLLVTESTLEGMGYNGNGGKNDLHERGTRCECMEYCNRRQKGLKTESMNVMMTQLRCSDQGRLDDAATQNRPGGDHKDMRKIMVTHDENQHTRRKV